MRNKSVLIVIAALIAGSLVTSAASAAVITSFTYAYNANGYLPHASYPDSSGTELNDTPTNPIPSAAFSDPGWVGILNNPPKIGSQAQPQIDLTFDQVYAFTSITITYLKDITNGGIYAPDHLDLSFSMNGVTYSAPQTYTGFNDAGADPSVKTLTLNLTGNVGQYVIAEFYAGNGGATNTFTFLGELDFAGTVPEPTGLSVALVAAIGLVRRRRPR